MTFQLRETILVATMVAAGLGLVFWVSNPQPSAAPSAADLAVAPQSQAQSPIRQPGGDPSFSYAGQEFTVPEPGDPEWEDYQAMLRDPRVQTSASQSPGFRLPYDPEWRSMVTGRREVPPISFPLVGYSDSLEELAQEFLDALRDNRPEILAEMRVDEDEWTEVFWPEFPQSRPYLKIPAEEAWDFHDAEARSAANKALREHVGTALTLESLSHGEPVVYTNFSLVGDLRIHAVNEETGESVEISLLSMVAERQGRYKAYIFNEG